MTHFSQIRNEVVHNILYQDIKYINTLLKGFDKSFYNLLTQLLSLNIKQMEFIDKNYDYVCDSCFKEALPKQVKF